MPTIREVLIVSGFALAGSIVWGGCESLLTPYSETQCHFSEQSLFYDKHGEFNIIDAAKGLIPQSSDDFDISNKYDSGGAIIQLSEEGEKIVPAGASVVRKSGKIKSGAYYLLLIVPTYYVSNISYNYFYRRKCKSERRKYNEILESLDLTQ